MQSILFPSCKRFLSTVLTLSLGILSSKGLQSTQKSLKLWDIKFKQKSENNVKGVQRSTEESQGVQKSSENVVCVHYVYETTCLIAL